VTYTGGSGACVCTFTYDATAAVGGPSQALVTVTQTINAAPVVTGESTTVTVNSTDNSIEVLSNDTDLENDNIRVLTATATCGTVTTTFPTGWVTPGTSQSISYNAPASGPCTINYTVEDAFGNTAGGSVAVTINTVPPFTDDTETWTGCTDDQLMSGSYYWTWGNAGSDGNTETPARNNWYCGVNATTSNSTGPYGTNNETTAAWADSPYIYTEASSTVFQSGDHLYIQSPVLDGSSYDFSLSFDYAMDATLGTNTSLQIWVDNGTGTFAHHVTIQTGSDANGWTTNMTPVDLSQYNNSSLRIRIVVVIDGTAYQNDVTIDNIFLNGTP